MQLIMELWFHFIIRKEGGSIQAQTRTHAHVNTHTHTQAKKVSFSTHGPTQTHTGKEGNSATSEPPRGNTELSDAGQMGWGCMEDRGHNPPKINCTSKRQQSHTEKQALTNTHLSFSTCQAIMREMLFADLSLSTHTHTHERTHTINTWLLHNKVIIRFRGWLLRGKGKRRTEEKRKIREDNLQMEDQVFDLYS